MVYHLRPVNFLRCEKHDAFERAFAEASARQASIGKLRRKLWVAPASGGFNSASHRIGSADVRPELIAPSKDGPHPPTVSGATPKTTRGTRVLPHFLRAFFHLSSFPIRTPAVIVCRLILYCIQSNINNPIKTGEGLDLGG